MSFADTSLVVGGKAGAVPENALLLQEVSKRFGSFDALTKVSMSVHRGEIHALLGENGAGKTTLMNIVAGLFRADSGSIAVNGVEAAPRNPRESVGLGIGMVHQQFSLVDAMTVAENVHLGWTDTPRWTSGPLLEARTRHLAETYGLDVDPRRPVWRLSVGEMQRVAILRTLARGAEILVLDEPTAVLTPQEADQLFDNIRSLRADGKTIILISHKLREVFEVADRATVLRRGQLVGSRPIAEYDRETLVVQMIGHSVSRADERAPLSPLHETAKVALEVEAIHAKDERGTLVLQDVDLAVRAGEIVGIASIAGNGGRELAEVLTGMRRPTSGRIRVNGENTDDLRRRSFARLGVGHIPEHYRTGLSLDGSVETNAVMKAVEDPRYHSFGVLRWPRLRRLAGEITAAAGLDRGHHRRRAATLSGGQAQRLIIARELRAGRVALVAAYPTRGLDVGAARSVQDALVSAREREVGVILFSEDLDELFTLCDRLAVLFEGRIAGSLGRAEFDLERVGHLMAGASA